MKTDPFTDAFLFLVGSTGDHENLGWGRYPMVLLFLALLIASACLARFNWKLPLPDAGGLRCWTEQMVEHAEFPFYAEFVRTVMLPHMTIVDPLVFVAEMGLAISFIREVTVRPVAALGSIYALGLWIGLCRHPGEWP